jgi:DNA-binding protein YbaB
MSINDNHETLSELVEDNVGEVTKPDTVKMLQDRIAELELELKKQRYAAEKGENLLKVMWGDDFNHDSLH